MANDKKTGVDRFKDEVVQDILAASDEEILEEAREAGEDPEAYAEGMRQWLAAAKAKAGKRILAQARQDLERDRQNTETKVVRLRQDSKGPHVGGFVPDTVAARLENDDQSDRDKKFEKDDLNELFDDDAWNSGDEDS